MACARGTDTGQRKSSSDVHDSAIDDADATPVPEKFGRFQRRTRRLGWVTERLENAHPNHVCAGEHAGHHGSLHARVALEHLWNARRVELELKAQRVREPD